MTTLCCCDEQENRWAWLKGCRRLTNRQKIGQVFKHLFYFLLCQRGELARTPTLWLWTVLSWMVIGFVSLTQQCWHQKVWKQTLFRWENWELDELQSDLLARKPESDRRVEGSAKERSVVLPDGERKGFCQNHWGRWLSQRIESSWKWHYRSQDVISEMLKTPY